MPTKRARPGLFVSTVSGAEIVQKFKRGRVELWTREKIESLSTAEVRQLQANALRLSEPEIAALCDDVLGTRPRGRVAVKA